MDYSQIKAHAAGYIPYYMYRQKNTVGNYENVGFSREGHEGLYNIYMMEEIHSIFSAGAGAVKVNSPMPGTILKVEVTVGQAVKKGDTLCILEAMKMENAIPAPEDGTVTSINVQKGASVNAGDLLASLN